MIFKTLFEMQLLAILFEFFLAVAVIVCQVIVTNQITTRVGRPADTIDNDLIDGIYFVIRSSLFPSAPSTRLDENHGVCCQNRPTVDISMNDVIVLREPGIIVYA